MRIILNGDDFGRTHEANLGVAKAMKEGYISQTSVMVNTNYFDEAVRIAKEEGFLDKVGLHINLFEGTPLTGAYKKLKQYARYDMFDYRPDFFHKYLNLNVDVIQGELEAQIQKYLSGGFSLMNIDSHHCAFYETPVLTALIPLLKKYHFESVRYIGNSYFNGSKFRDWYGNKWIKKMDELNLKHPTYSSSVATFDKNMKKMNPALVKADAVEVYVHPVLVEGSFIDNFTGGTHLYESFKRTGLDQYKFITTKEI